LRTVRHHTKDKGDLGVGHVVADLLKAGIQPALLLSEHLPFDLIAIAPDNTLRTVSVKFRAAKRGAVTVELWSVWSDRHGVHKVWHGRGLYDALAVYCPDTGRVYYIRADELPSDIKRVTLRVQPSRNNQSEGVRHAEEYADPKRLFARRRKHMPS